jgi:hypothetical protein
MDSGPTQMSVRPRNETSEEGELPNGGDSLPMLPSVGDGGNAPPVPPTPTGRDQRNTAQLNKPSRTTPENSPAMSPLAPDTAPPGPQPAPTAQPKRRQ